MCWQALTCDLHALVALTASSGGTLCDVFCAAFQALLAKMRPATQKLRQGGIDFSQWCAPAAKTR